MLSLETGTRRLNSGRGDQPFQKFLTSLMKHHAEMSAEQGAMLGCSHTRVQTEFGSSAASLQRGKVSQVAAPLTSGSSGREPERALNGGISAPTQGTHRTQQSHQRTQHKLMLLLQAPGQIACLPAAAALADCVLCVFVSQWDVEMSWEVAHGWPHANL